MPTDNPASGYGELIPADPLTTALAEIAHLRAALKRHMQWCKDKRDPRDVKVCGGCLHDWPCPDAALLAGDNSG